MAQGIRIDWHRGELFALLESPGGPVTKDTARRAGEVEQRAKELCPKASNALANSISVGIPRNEGGLTIFEVGSDLDYAIYVEKGTQHMDAQPYLEPALQAAAQ